MNKKIDLEPMKHHDRVSADKGGITVIMNKNNYIEKIEEKLNDNKLYKKVKDPTNKIKSKINNITNYLFNKRRITEIQKLDFKSIDNLATVRGQPKLHKDGNPMRIITCTRSTILSSISLLTFNFIKHLRDTINNNVKNTEEFISKLIDIKIDKDDRLASLDVIDLFNNVPISKSIDIVLKRIEKTEIFCQSNLTKTDLRNLLELCLNNSYFTFNNKYYKQVKGLPMGNVLSPLLAHLYMHEFINNTLHEIKEKLFRYVDDLFIITKMKKTQLESYTESLNSKRTSIKFTCEYEEDAQINFLDTTITRNLNENKLDIRWFRKPTANDRFLNFHSSHHHSVKLNIIQNMTQRVINTTRNNEQQQIDLNKLKQMFLKSDFPKELIEKNYTKMFTKKC
ncbi:unnamed protein product [Rotaria sordida]|uniref:Telomerase catalytic subunit n=1 Tax=Rotaria sordida TaxID=392033 RepID=A0A815QXE8_9BILA|nr:unnamed protein product [Rotaria sordida]